MSESLQLAVGDRVVYPNQGLCTVTGIGSEQIAGQSLVFVSLVFEETKARVKVPQEKLVKNGVRRVSSGDDVKKLFEFLTAEGDKASLDWKKRARDNVARLAGGGLVGLASVVKELQVLSELRALPPKEREQYNDARHLLVTELAAAMGASEADAEDALDAALFPVGKERPKRSVEEFKALLGGEGEDGELGLGDDLLGIDGEGVEAAEPGEAGGDTTVEGEAAGEEEGEEKPKAEEPKKRGRPPKAAKEAKAEKPAPKAALSDVEVTLPQGLPLAPPLPKKRGRPPKAKPVEVVVQAPAETPAPKKRGRPPKAKTAAPAAAPKKRGRPAKAKK